ncbi:hotdog fold domain-containing protein [Branchiibius sp. NY16-3462-2]|uniref:hotdog fold domain-containing protein n=1 Tax=Branchiibius sp. NY16-3462-2 TaxID=1807500 RepID=UPI000791FBC4|nr:hotdog fold domain-containing protein [Branchiibius sp. NY16-3462-2]KYH43771.1 thioesterase [Branchiibius sp. NY16-3462-2]
MTATYHAYQKVAAKPFGRQLFSLVYMVKAPYFSTVRPQIRQMSPHRAEVTIKKRWRVQNHIGTVHAIAVANGMEAAMGLLAEATVAPGMRWLPRGIELEYLAKTAGDVTCVAETAPEDWAKEPPFDVSVRVSGTLADGTEVVRGVIPIYVSALKQAPVKVAQLA